MCIADNLQGRDTPLGFILVYLRSNHVMMCMIFFIERPTDNQQLHNPFLEVLTVNGNEMPQFANYFCRASDIISDALRVTQQSRLKIK